MGYVLCDVYLLGVRTCELTTQFTTSERYANTFLNNSQIVVVMIVGILIAPN